MKFTDAQRRELLAKAMESEEGRAVFKRVLREMIPEEIAGPLAKLVDGQIVPDQSKLRQAIVDNVLDAHNEGRWSTEDVASVLNGKQMSKEEFEALMKKGKGSVRPSTDGE